MNWRLNQQEVRRRLIEQFDQSEVVRYASWADAATDSDEQALLNDLSDVVSFGPGMKVLDLGAGTGALSRVLKRVNGLQLTALEPVPAMLEHFRAHVALQDVATFCGFCDAAEDQFLFPSQQFDIIAGRQIANGLFDPLQAFRNCHHWLAPNGTLVLIDGFYDRTAWTGIWEDFVDALPLSACRTIATVPYLLEQCGFVVNMLP